MTDIENQERIAQVRARLSAATPGPWRESREAVTIKSGQPVFESRIVAPAQNIAYHIGRAEVTRLPQDRHSPGSSFDADFIANAPTDLAFLLSRVDSLESALREATQDVRKQFADEGFEIPSVKDAAELINEYSGMIRVEAAGRIAAERLHARHCGLECCEVRDEYDARTRQSPIGADTGEST